MKFLKSSIIRKVLIFLKWKSFLELWFIVCVSIVTFVAMVFTLLLMTKPYIVVPYIPLQTEHFLLMALVASIALVLLLVIFHATYNFLTTCVSIFDLFEEKKSDFEVEGIASLTVALNHLVRAVTANYLFQGFSIIFEIATSHLLVSKFRQTEHTWTNFVYGMIDPDFIGPTAIILIAILFYIRKLWSEKIEAAAVINRFKEEERYLL